LKEVESLESATLADLLAEVGRRLTALTTPVPAPAPTGLLTPEEAAKYLNVKATWVRDKARAGVIPFTRLGAYMRFRREDLDALARDGRN
jgi:excisionase family DNA binding protein